MIRKLSCIVTTLAVAAMPLGAHAANLTVITEGGAQVTFSDVPDDVWFTTHVKTAAEAGVITGYKNESGEPIGQYGPDDQVSLEQMAKIAFEASGRLTANCSGNASNATAQNRWSEIYVSCAEELDWDVFAGGTVDVRQSATRAEVSGILAAAFEYDTGSASGEEFVDVSSSTRYAAEIETLAAKGIVRGYADTSGQATGYFGPRDNVNRAEAAKMAVLSMEHGMGTGGDMGGDGDGDGDGETRVITVAYGSSFFDPSTITVESGQQVTLDFQGSGIHTFLVDGIDLDVDLTQHGSVTFMAPDPGEYTFYCDIPGHREQGMEGTLVVEAQGQAS